jgi:hypothetical protein
MYPLRVVPDPLVYPTCEWCGSTDSLGMLHRGPCLGNDLVCYRCYRDMFRPIAGRVS